jgi:capsular polysaccharide biosynthesis protein
MTEQQIIESMVKGRESCRKVIQTFQIIRSKSNDMKEPVDSQLLLSANRAASQMLNYVSELSSEINNVIKSDENRQYASRLITEIRQMLERAMILEREMRDLVKS